VKTGGISIVRIGEFAWSRLEPTPGQYHFDWLERAIDTLQAAGLSVVLGTPTATPPRWLIEQHPEMLALDEHGRPRGFGSRRHYCFSSTAYLQECVRICTALGERFGHHPAVVAWQTDNEFGCHSTTHSYSSNALLAFRTWCAKRYSDIDALNTAWGNVFWSMEYPDFDSIGLPVGAVTETNPSQRLAFWRFSSDQVVRFNRVQVDILRQLSPERDIVHNFMGNFMEFDHFAVAKDLDVATWDNYPLGFLTRDGTSEADQINFLRTGHPDSSAFHHDLYRSCGQGRMWLMEQQPGPVNWAPYNPAPLPGMVRLWGWEAFAHGAEVVSYFRWRQASFAQEQMHAGLCLPNGEDDIGAQEVGQLGNELKLLEKLDTQTRQAPIALILDYTGDQMQRIQQPGGRIHDPLQFTQRVYSACRQLGVDVDVVSPDSVTDGYRLILASTSTESNRALVERLSASDAQIVLFPRTGSKTSENTIPDNLPPGDFQELIALQVTRMESVPAFEKMTATTHNHSHTYTAIDWRESVTTSLQPHAAFSDGWGFHFQQGRVHYVNACLDQPSLMQFMQARCNDCGIVAIDIGDGVRTRLCGEVRFVFNYGPGNTHLDTSVWQSFGLSDTNPLLLGKRQLAPAELCAWVIKSED